MPGWFSVRPVRQTEGMTVNVHGSGTAGIALLWHGRGPREAYALAPLAEAAATSGIRVLAADWDSTAADHGRADLEASLDQARRAANEIGIDPQRLVLVGWSLGATAALGLALGSAEPLRTILVAPGYAERATDAFSGRPLPDIFAAGNGHPIDVLWGSRDEVVDETMAIAVADRLRDAGWAVTTTELDADHSGVVGVRFDDGLDRYVVDPHATDAMATVAAAIVAATTS